MWSEKTGLIDLQSMLLSAGVNLSGWSLEAAIGVSEDGTTVFGHGNYLGQSRPWMAVVPSPSGLVLIAGVLGWPRRRRA